MRPRVTLLILILMTILITMPEVASAQCAMCRAAAENSLREGSTQAAGLNKGILYLAMFPYVAVGFLGFLAWRHWRKRRLAETA